MTKTAQLYQQLQTRKDLAVATLAGGCFWCLESPLEQLPGVVTAVAGYAGGSQVNPSYDQVSAGLTDHREAVQVFYDPKQVAYEQLLATFWLQVDPTDEGGQFADRGQHYQTAIFYHSPAQQQSAELSKQQLDQSGRYPKPVTTEILPFKTFYLAEEEHQDYYQKNYLHYQAYQRGSGRAQHIEETKKFFSQE